MTHAAAGSFPSIPRCIARLWSAWRDVYSGVASHGITGLALGGLQWGPLCVLAVMGPALQIAEYAAVARTAQVVEIVLPVVLFAPRF